MTHNIQKNNYWWCFMANQKEYKTKKINKEPKGKKVINE